MRRNIRRSNRNMPNKGTLRPYLRRTLNNPLCMVNSQFLLCNQGMRRLRRWDMLLRRQWDMLRRRPLRTEHNLKCIKVPIHNSRQWLLWEGKRGIKANLRFVGVDDVHLVASTCITLIRVSLLLPGR